MDIDCKNLIMKLLIAFALLIANTALHAGIGDEFPKIGDYLSKPLPNSKDGTTDSGPFLKKRSRTVDLSLENIPSLRKGEDKALLKVLKSGLWEIEKTALVDENKKTWEIKKISYTNKIESLNDKVREDIIFHNRHPDSVQIEFEPQNRPRTITITSRDLKLELDNKNKQLTDFGKHWRCIGLTLAELKDKFEDPVKIDNDGIYHFTSRPNDKQINWEVRVKLWKGLNDQQEVAHRVVYECHATKFSHEEQAWLRLINSNQVGWNWNGFDKLKGDRPTYITRPAAPPKLRAWVDPLRDEVGIETVELSN